MRKILKSGRQRVRSPKSSSRSIGRRRRTPREPARAPAERLDDGRIPALHRELAQLEQLIDPADPVALLWGVWHLETFLFSKSTPSWFISGLRRAVMLQLKHTTENRTRKTLAKLNAEIQDLERYDRVTDLRDVGRTSWRQAYRRAAEELNITDEAVRKSVTHVRARGRESYFRAAGLVLTNFVEETKRRQAQTLVTIPPE